MEKNKTSKTKSIHHGRSKQILIDLRHNGELTTTYFAEKFGINSQNISGYLECLKAEKFVDSTQSIYDKRVFYHSITQRGREFLDGIYESVVKNTQETKLYTPEVIKDELEPEFVEKPMSLTEWKKKNNKILVDEDDEGNLFF